MAHSLALSILIMKFIVDTMLGRLARWLRLFGEDA
ncbi:MAG TPA: hypothetical protein ENL24_00370, partial [candidate division Zixibacteria bacterium]|nr:hypothetical protein [candidate division Zixibacteria bacterium]